MALITILFAAEPQALGALGAVERRHDDRFAHHIERRQGRRQLGVLVHHAREQVLIEAPPVDSDPHRLLVGAGGLDHLGELRIALRSAADVARIDPELRERLRTVGMSLEQLVPVEVKVADQRGCDALGVQTLADTRHGGRGFVIVDGDPNQLRPGPRQRLDLSDRAFDVGRVGVGHGLHDDGGAAADGDRADLDSEGFSA